MTLTKQREHDVMAESVRFIKNQPSDNLFLLYSAVTMNLFLARRVFDNAHCFQFGLNNDAEKTAFVIEYPVPILDKTHPRRAFGSEGAS